MGRNGVRVDGGNVFRAVEDAQRCGGDEVPDVVGQVGLAAERVEEGCGRRVGESHRRHRRQQLAAVN